MTQEEQLDVTNVVDLSKLETEISDLVEVLQKEQQEKNEEKKQVEETEKQLLEEQQLQAEEQLKVEEQQKQTDEEFRQAVLDALSATGDAEVVSYVEQLDVISEQLQSIDDKLAVSSGADQAVYFYLVVVIPLILFVKFCWSMLKQFLYR